jgi:hypothetical protein
VERGYVDVINSLKLERDRLDNLCKEYLGELKNWERSVGLYRSSERKMVGRMEKL